jgi:hypothetical protein
MEERISSDAYDGASQASASKDDPVRKASLASEVLCWCNRNDLWAMSARAGLSDEVYIL